MKSRRWKRLAAGALAGAACAVAPYSAAHAVAWYNYYTTANPLPYSWSAGGPVTTVYGYGMTGCLAGGGYTGAWNKNTNVRSGGAVIHGHQYAGTMCPSYINFSGHSHTGSYASCWTSSNMAPFYADCKSYH